MGFIKEFKEFAVKGNVVDLAIAVVLGAAFGKIVTALTDSIIMPIISLILGKGGVSDLKFIMGRTVFPIGILLQAIIDFILIALILFLIIKGINRLNRKKDDPVAVPKAPEYTLQEKLLMEIRDNLRR
ncbi:MAG TPA: large conductance mechanosensitive channel protein MscL [Flavisolibacter sp.]|nr:large conductance mechanosensitive channel protein MscL [Flavisolibacter sp.]